jgi:branched-subunit amino acid aminotransferase/4-amino-4-deoxychorismate lyase
MHGSVSLNGEIVRVDKALLPAISVAAFYGKGVFTTLSIYDREPFLWDKHWRRLNENAKWIGLDLSDQSESTTRESLSNLIARNNSVDSRARITFFDRSATAAWPIDGDRKLAILITTAAFRYKSQRYRLTVSPYSINSRSPLAGVKSCNYLEHLLAYEEAIRLCFDEALRSNESGHMSSACMANVFWQKNGRLFTPSLATGCLRGTTREFILENIECKEVEADRSELESVDAIFLTSAGIGVVAAAEFDGRELQNVRHPILDLLPKPKN